MISFGSNTYSQGSGLSTRVIAQNAFKSTLLVSMEDNNSQPLSLGSGFVIDNEVIVTNYHVIEKSNSGFVRLIDNQRRYRITGIIEISEKYDIAILKVEGLLATKLKLGSIQTVEIGDNVFAVGNPRGLEGTFSQGIISGIRSFGSDRLLQITAPISPGSSGGPVLNGNGEVIGVAVASLRDGQNLNFAIPIDYVTNLYNNSPKTLTRFNNLRPTGQQSLLASFGTNVKDEVIGTAFSWNDNRFMGYYTFSVRNNLDYAIKNIFCLVIFYDENKLPIEVEYVLMEDIIPARLAKRSERQGRIPAEEVRNLTHYYTIRVLDFDILN